MKKNCNTWLLFLLLLGFLSVSQFALATPVAWDQKEQNWLSQQSQHFTVNFLDGYQKNAARVLDIAEHVHQQLLPFFKTAPQTRTEIVLVDDYDFSNGWASLLPFAQIRLIMSPPEDVNDLEVTDEWLYSLMLHEYVHILHGELNNGAVSVLRGVFGRNLFLFPHVLTPSVLLEGLAVYLETDKQVGYGRLQGSNYAMQMRMQVAGGQLKDMQQVVAAQREWPFNSPYLYGAYFIEYLTKTYGKEKLQLFLEDYSRQLLPYFLLNRRARLVFGKDFLHLWQDFQAYLNVYFSNQIGQLQQQAVSGETLDKNLFLQVTGTSDHGLVVNRKNGQDKETLAQLNITANGQADWQNPVMSKGITDIAAHSSAGLAVSRRINYADGRFYNDLFLYKNKNWTRLTARQRFRKVRWLPDGKHLLASRKQGGKSELWLIDIQKKGAQKRIWQGEQDVVLGGFALSAAGDYLVASLKRAHQGWNLERLSLADNAMQWQALTDSKAVENSPEILADGRILFSADYQGVYNIYVLDPQTRLLTQWTREVGGAFQPHWQPGIGLVYQSYDSDGYTLRYIEKPQPLSVIEVDSTQGRYDYPQLVPEHYPESSPQHYRPWSTLRPRTWLPYWSIDQQESRYGITSYGEDALARHRYQLAADWDTSNSIANYSLNYQYDNRWYIGVLRSHDITEETVNDVQGSYIFQDDYLSIQRRNLFVRGEDNLRWHAGIVWDTTRLVEQPDFVNESSYQSLDETLIGLALTFDNREQYLNVPGVGRGNYLDLIAEKNTPFSDDYRGEKLQGQWKGTFDLYGRNTLTARLGAGYASSEAKTFFLGGHDLLEETFLFGRDTQALRGYGESVQAGHRYLSGRLQFNAWLARVERNWRLLPIGLGDISGALFVDSGAAWNKGQTRRQLTGIGGELLVELQLGYQLTLPVTFGLAKGMDNELGQNQGYITIQIAF